MRKFAVFGLGQFGRKVAEILHREGMDVIAIDKNPELVDNIKPYVSDAVSIDATDQKSLGTVDLSDVDVAIVSLASSLEDSVLITILLKELGIPQIIAKAFSEEHRKILESVGATEVIFPEEEMAESFARRIISPNVLDYIPLMQGYSIVEILAPAPFWWKDLLTLNLRRDYGVEILAIKQGEELIIIPSAFDKISEGDTLVIFGKDEDIENIRKLHE